MRMRDVLGTVPSRNRKHVAGAAQMQSLTRPGRESFPDAFFLPDLENSGVKKLRMVSPELGISPCLGVFREMGLTLMSAFLILGVKRIAGLGLAVPINVRSRSSWV